MVGDVAAERAVLSDICRRGGEAFADVSDVIDRECFTLEASRNLWECLCACYKDDPAAVIDLSVVFSIAESVGLGEFYARADEQKYLRAIFNFPVRDGNVRKFAKKLRKLKIIRDLGDLLHKSAEQVSTLKGEESFEEIIAEAEGPLTQYIIGLHGDHQEGPKQMAEGVREYLDYTEANPCSIPGISSGFKLFDKAIGGGLRPGSVNVVGARRKVGKSIFGDNVAYGVSRQQIPVLVLDTEMSEKDHWNRVLAMLSGVPSEVIETGRTTPSQKQTVEKARDYLSNLPWDYIPIHGRSFDSILAIMRRWILQRVGLDANGKANPCLFVYDYLKLMSSEPMTSGGIAEYQALGFMLTQLHDFMQRWQSACLSFVQLNQEQKVSQSDRISWLCTSLSFLSLKSDDEIAGDIAAGHRGRQWNRKLTPECSRFGNGLGDGEAINFHLSGPIAKLIEGGVTSNPMAGSVEKPPVFNADVQENFMEE